MRLFYYAAAAAIGAGFSWWLLSKDEDSQPGQTGDQSGPTRAPAVPPEPARAPAVPSTGPAGTAPPAPSIPAPPGWPAAVPWPGGMGVPGRAPGPGATPDLVFLEPYGAGSQRYRPGAVVISVLARLAGTYPTRSVAGEYTLEVGPPPVGTSDGATLVKALHSSGRDVWIFPDVLTASLSPTRSHRLWATPISGDGWTNTPPAGMALLMLASENYPTYPL